MVKMLRKKGLGSQEIASLLLDEGGDVDAGLGLLQPEEPEKPSEVIEITLFSSPCCLPPGLYRRLWLSALTLAQ